MIERFRLSDTTEEEGERKKRCIQLGGSYIQICRRTLAQPTPTHTHTQLVTDAKVSYAFGAFNGLTS